MGFLNEYLIKYGSKSFTESKINEIDLVSLAMLPLINLENIVSPKANISFIKAMEMYNLEFGIRPIGLVIPVVVPRMLLKLSRHQRYANLIISDYIKIIDIEKEEQFCALKLSDDKLDIIIFCGTDDTCVGWKENFNLLLEDNVPAQLDATKFLNKVFNAKKETYVAGHSKGGMLALYAATFASQKVKKQIKAVYSFDGPGLLDKVVFNKEYQEMKDKYFLILPQESIIGRLFYFEGTKCIVHSKNVALNQHDSQSWEIEDDHFVKEEIFIKESDHVLNKLQENLLNLPLEKRRKFIETIYEMLCAGGNTTLLNLHNHKMDFLRVYHKAEKSNKEIIRHTLIKLVTDRVVTGRIFAGMFEYKKYKKENKLALKNNKVQNSI